MHLIITSKTHLLMSIITLTNLLEISLFLLMLLSHHVQGTNVVLITIRTFYVDPHSIELEVRRFQFLSCSSSAYNRSGICPSQASAVYIYFSHFYKWKAVSRRLIDDAGGVFYLTHISTEAIISDTDFYSLNYDGWRRKRKSQA